MEHGRGCVELGVGVGVGREDSVMVVELLSGRFLHEGESELAAVNQMVRQAGTMGLNVGGMGGDEEQKEEREWFDGLCSHNHIHFPDMEDSIAALVRERIPEVGVCGMWDG